ncbi:MAG: mechanosensitive ion channel domain-containing protein, partial [Acidimicrobiales bacterium]
MPWTHLAQTDGSTDGSSGDTSGGADGDLTTEIDNTIKVALDKWSVGQIGWPDFWLALGVLAIAVVLAYLVRRFIRYSTGALDGTAAAAVALTGQLVSVGIYLFAVALVLEILGFTLGPVLILGLLVVVLFLVLRPLVQNLTSGLVLQLRGHCQPGELVEIDGELGTVVEVNTRAVVLLAPDGRT